MIQIIKGTYSAIKDGERVTLTRADGPIDWLSENAKQVLVQRGVARYVEPAQAPPPAPLPAPPPPPDEPPAKPLDEMSLAELRARGESMGIDPKGKTTKAKWIAAIEAADSQPAGPKSLKEMDLAELRAFADAQGIDPEVYEDVRDDADELRAAISEALADA